MDDALAQAIKLFKSFIEAVLILVVMDDALARHREVSHLGKSGLNPCCNG